MGCGVVRWCPAYQVEGLLRLVELAGRERLQLRRQLRYAEKPSQAGLQEPRFRSVIVGVVRVSSDGDERVETFGI